MYVIVLFMMYDEDCIEEVIGPFDDLAAAHAYSQEHFPWPGPHFRRYFCEKVGAPK